MSDGVGESVSSSNPGLVTVKRWTGEGDGNHSNRLTLLLAVMNHAVLMSVSMAIAWLRSGRLYCCSSFFSLRVGKEGLRVDWGGPEPP